MKIVSRRPSSWPGELWREALPVGNGLTGALLSCGAGVEHIWLNRFDRWDGEREEVPCVKEAFEKQRQLVLDGLYREAKTLLSDALTEKGYRGETAVPSEPVKIRIRYDLKQPFCGYERGIDLEKGLAYTNYSGIKRQALVSRDDTFYYRFESESPVNAFLYLPEGQVNLTVFSDVLQEKTEDYTLLRGTKRFEVRASFGQLSAIGFDEALEKQLPLYSGSDISLEDEGRTNEQLIDEAVDGEASPELINKLWHFGRYLFASGTSEGGNPFPLYGLWHGVKNPQWAQNVANENVQMIYWHACPGGMASLVRPLIHYYNRLMPDFRDNARNIFGLEGIMVSVYSTPLSGHVAPNVPVITNFTGAAGWLCRHFYEYYLYTRDEELLEKEILPFMLEAARFYEQYAVIKDGVLTLAPSVSPENSPGNLMPDVFTTKLLAHPNPVVKNSVMELAIIKDLLTSLIELSKTHNLGSDRLSVWKQMLAAMPGYMVNSDGAVKEWSAADLSDNYRHRHLSHIYPLFPGNEVSEGHPLFDAFKRAVDLRELGAQSGWSLAHMAAIYARMGEGEKAFECINTLCRGCLLNNLFTLHNDWRDMGLTLDAAKGAPVQLDALMGIVNAVQEMLMQFDGRTLKLLPALPKALSKGSFKDMRIPDACVSASWDKTLISLSVTAIRDTAFDVAIPGRERKHIALKQGETVNL